MPLSQGLIYCIIPISRLSDWGFIITAYLAIDIVRGGGGLTGKRDQVDEVEVLMRKIESSKNRKEKRRHMAEYNQVQTRIYGQAKSLSRVDNVLEAIVKTNMGNLYDNQKVYNPATKSYIDKELYDKCIEKETISENPAEKNQKKRTQVLSKNQKLHSVNVYERTQRFEYKVNIENEKQRQLFREKMGQRNQMVEENFHVIEAIEEGQRVSAYFETNEQAKEFLIKLAELKYAGKKYYNLKEIEANSKLSISPDHKVIPTREELSKLIVGGNVTPKLAIQNEQGTLIEGSGGQKALPGEGEKSSLKLTPSNLERKEVKNQQDQFVISRAKPIDNIPEKAQANQKKQLLKVIAVDDRYIAENYYQSANMDELLHEKDGTISKMRQFDYKIHKYKPGKTVIPKRETIDTSVGQKK